MKKAVLIILITVIFSSTTTPVNAQTKQWGGIANSVRQGGKVRGAFFFAGPPNPNSLQFYTRNPINMNKYNWQTESDVDFIFDELEQAFVNVIKLSWWGENGEYQKWAPTWNTKDINQQVFAEATSRNMLVAPILEVSSPDFEFWREFPSNTTNLENRIIRVLADYGQNSSWLQLYDRNGQPRYVIWLIETIHAGSVDEVLFAAKFDEVAGRIKTQTGVDIGFVIDPTPLPPNGSYAGPNPIYLQNSNSILAINPFNITSDGTTDSERIQKGEEVLSRWKNAGFPLMAPVLPGYDDHLVRPPGTIYGDTSEWRSEVKRVAETYQTVGITLDIWNGFTEGYAFVPTTETGDTNFKLSQAMFRSLLTPTDIKMALGEYNSLHLGTDYERDNKINSIDIGYTVGEISR